MKKRERRAVNGNISSKNLTAEEILNHARMEWGVESMHWLLDVHFEEYYCRIEDKTIRDNLSLLRKLGLNIVRRYKEKSKSKLAFSKIMPDFLLDSSRLLEVVCKN